MRVLIVYGTTEGQTEKIAGYARDRLDAQGHSVILANAGTAPAPADFDAVILAASLHVGKYQAPIVAYAHLHRLDLQARPNAFISVSLSAAGHDQRDWAGVERCLKQFIDATGWTPRTVHQAAGALRYSQYNWLTRIFMRRIARERGADTRHDVEFTDWQALGSFLNAFAPTQKRSPDAPKLDLRAG